MPRYDPPRIEVKWQQYWAEHKTFETPDRLEGKQKLYVLDMFPYPSGNGLHVGHPEGYTATDIVCRYSRMRGRHVLHPMGWDAFGLPAEQHAIQTGTHPRMTTDKNINTFRRQLKMLGFSYDWSREFSTTDPDYFRWTQWIFLRLFESWYDPGCRWTGPDGKARTGRGRPICELPIPDDIRRQGDEAVRRYRDRHRLAYQHETPVNWCPVLRTVLANEEVNAQGRSERGDHPIERLPLRQWMLRITAYADRLLSELDDVDWSESIKLLQRNWIGKSHGANVDFHIGPAEASGQRKPAGANSADGVSESQEHQGANAPRSPADDEFAQWKVDRDRSGFPAEPGDDVLRVYTTRPDTLFGATYMVLAPEHPFVERLTIPDQQPSVEAYCRQAATKSDLDRTDLAKEKIGIFTGSYAVNPVNGECIPIWIADYVLISYGTGAIMAVPAHDLRDWEFAVEFGLSMTPVVQWSADYEPTKEEQALSRQIDGKTEFPFAGEGTAINSGRYDGLSTAKFKQQIAADLAQQGLGKQAVNYKLRDWLFSRQHFWGEPFPIWHELDDQGNPTGLLRTDSEDELPVELPKNFDFKPPESVPASSSESGGPEPPLEEAPADWLYKTADDGTRLKRETNTMPQWAGSCWYYLRFADPKNDQTFVDPEQEKYWLPVDLYVGGAEHAVLHLLYSRFWHKLLFDRGDVSHPEPFQRLVNQGMILGAMEFHGLRSEDDEWTSFEPDPNDWVVVSEHLQYQRKVDGKLFIRTKLKESDVEKRGENWFVIGTDAKVDARTYKMSKSRGNVINPDNIVDRYGADALRLYEMFMGPLEQVKPWSMSGVEGVYRFLGRVWRMIADNRADDVCLNTAVRDVEPNQDQLRVLHKTIKAVSEDVEKLSFNTAISRMMEFTNEISGQDPRPKAVLEPFVLLLSPFAPHMAEECWQLLGHDQTLAYEPWPKFDETYLVETEIEIPVQVNGKLRAKVKVPADADESAIQSAAEQDASVMKHLEGKQPVKVIVIPGRLVNFVIKG